MARKLAARDYGAEEAAAVITQLQQEGLQNDRRYAEVYIRSRMEKGYGPLRITLELRDRGISTDLTEELLRASAVDWHACIARVREKKYGPARPGNLRDRARQARFLESRGFTSEQIQGVFR